MHIIRSLLHLTKHSETYVPIAPYLVPILTSTLTPSSRPKPSTLRPLDLEVQIRAPQQYMKKRVYSEGILEETAFLLGEWLLSPAVQGSIAFPEIIVPIVTVLRKSLKTARSKSGAGTGSGKDYDVVKILLERVEESGRWMEAKRKDISFAPGRLGDVQRWETDLKSTIEDSPLGKYVKVLRKTKEKRRKLVEKVRARDTASVCLYTTEWGFSDHPTSTGSRR
jgi:nucleolar complex protein 2